MATPVLRELGISNANDRPLLDLFQSSRECVERVAVTPLVPAHLAVATRSGFVQLIRISDGEFRLFASHLNHVFLDASIRCFALVPSLYAVRHHHHLLYSLAYSNELLLADLDDGAVTALSTYTSRPCAVYCDGDYMVCGVGTGQVTVWRSPDVGFEPLWQAPLFEDSVTSMHIYRGQLVCCSADYQCLVVDIETGCRIARLPQDPSAAIAVFPFMMPRVPHTMLTLCLPSTLSVYTGPPSGESGSTDWLYVGGVPLESPIRCATCLGCYMAAGTLAGVVLLYECDASTGDVEELARFDVGFGVIGLQLYPNDILLVVTSAGDVWKWPLADLLQSAEEHTEEADDVPYASTSAPLPSSVPMALPHSNDTSQVEGFDLVQPRVTPTSGAALHDSMQEVEVVMTGDDDELEARAYGVGVIDESDGAEHQQQPDTTKMMTPMDGEGGEPIAFNEYAGLAGDCVTTMPCHSERIQSSKASTSEQGSIEKSDRCSMFSTETHTTSASEWQVTGTVMCTSDGDAGTATRIEHVTGREVGTIVPHDQLSTLGDLERTLGSPAVISGLRRGRRMDPRKIVSVMQSHETLSSAQPVAMELHITDLLKEQQAALYDAAFDFDQYTNEHCLEVDALKFRHPVRMPTIALHDRAFGGVSAVADHPAHAYTVGDSEVQDSTMVHERDDLMETTCLRFVRKRNPELEDERRRGGPDIHQHPCDELIYLNTGPSGTVLFKEYQMKPCAPVALQLPLPLPPSSSVF